MSNSSGTHRLSAKCQPHIDQLSCDVTIYMLNPDQAPHSCGRHLLTSIFKHAIELHEDTATNISIASLFYKTKCRNCAAAG